MLTYSNIILLSLEGNIGSGKTTILQKLKETNPEWVFVDEPVDDWLALKNADGESLLEVFYKDKKRWSYTFQNAAVLYRYQKLRAALDLIPPGKPTVVLMERSLETDRQVFCRMLHKDGFVDNLENKLYEAWFSHLISMLPPVDGYIFVNTTPELSFDRVATRARLGESVIPITYLKELDIYHRSWLFGEHNGDSVLDFDNTKESLDIRPIVRFAETRLNSKVHSLLSQ